MDRLLRECNFPSIAIHSGLSQEERISRYTQFKAFEKRVLVATDIFGRGIDVERVNSELQNWEEGEKESARLTLTLTLLILQLSSTTILLEMPTLTFTVLGEFPFSCSLARSQFPPPLSVLGFPPSCSLFLPLSLPTPSLDLFSYFLSFLSPR